MSNILGSSLGIGNYVGSRDELPKGATPADYFTTDQALTYWQQVAKGQDINQFRLQLFNAGYYQAADGTFSLDWGDDITQSDLDALERAMTAANLADPLKGGKKIGLDQFLSEKADETQQGLTQRAQLEDGVRQKLMQFGIGQDRYNGRYTDQLLRGDLSDKDLDMAMKEQAKQLYPAWANQIDAGMSMADIAVRIASWLRAFLRFLIWVQRSVVG